MNKEDQDYVDSAVNVVRQALKVERKPSITCQICEANARSIAIDLRRLKLQKPVRSLAAACLVDHDSNHSAAQSLIDFASDMHRATTLGPSLAARAAMLLDS